MKYHSRQKMSQYVVGVGLASFVGGVLAHRAFCRWLSGSVMEENRPLKHLKNALLTFALLVVKRRAFDTYLDHLYNYDKYDGSALPYLSGSGVTNACFTYNVDREELRRSPWYNVLMEHKQEAIEKWLEKNLGTEEQVVAFFEKFVERAAGVNGKLTVK